MCCWMGVFFIRWGAVCCPSLGCRLICTRILTLECRTKSPRRSSCTTAQTLSLVGCWQTLLDAGCCIKLFQLTLIAFSLGLFRVCPRVPVLDSTRRKKFNEIDTTKFWKTKEKQQLRSIVSGGWILNGAESGFCFHKRKCVGRLSLWHKLYKTYPLVN
jgi:hypothetical protein